MLPDIKSQTAEELQMQFQSWAEPAYRVNQVLQWLYRHRVTDWDSMTNIPLTLRDRLRESFSFYNLVLLRKQGSHVMPQSLVRPSGQGARATALAARVPYETEARSRDITQKYLWRLADHSLIESVLIPANPALYGDPSDRQTLCVSTQVGCAYGCKFCASGLEGLKRNLRVEEIVDQVLAVEREQAPCEPGQVEASAAGRAHIVSNLVIMGMGEPLANYDNLLKALKILNAPWGGGIGARKITVSTSGLAPQIRRLAEEPLQLRLAISLHGATDPTRNRIMPVNRKYPLRELQAACEYYLEKKGRMLTFEYILIAGVNDGLAEVKPLASLARRLKAKINLIPYNKVEGLPWERPSPAAQERFLAALQNEKVIATLRREKGHDIDAACGQLRLKTEREFAGGTAPQGL